MCLLSVVVRFINSITVLAYIVIIGLHAEPTTSPTSPVWLFIYILFFFIFLYFSICSFGLWTEFRAGVYGNLDEDDDEEIKTNNTEDSSDTKHYQQREFKEINWSDITK